MTSEPFTAEQIITDPNGARFVLKIEGEVEVTRGPLGRFLDLAEAIRAEGLEVPPGLAAVLELEQRPTLEAWADLNQRWETLYRTSYQATSILSQILQVLAGTAGDDAGVALSKIVNVVLAAQAAEEGEEDHA